MRVIAGSAGGIHLKVPKAAAVRPTMDRVKAAIFSSLADCIAGADVLDLFAGTGALGIEALSRGASSAIFVEQNREAVAVIEQNFIRTKLRGRVRNQEVFAFLSSARPDDRFDIIFADPPYEKTKEGGEFTRLLLTEPKLARLLKPDGIFMLEKRPEEHLLSLDLWRVVRQKRYGATEVLFLQHAEGGNSVPDEQT